MFCKEWHAAGAPEATVSVNLSMKSLADVQLAERLTELVRGEGLAAKHMIFEVAESAANSEIGHALENLSRLRMRGFGLSIDNYGGSSSLQQLTRVSFTEIKIDRSFVANAAAQRSARVVLESSLEMAKKLKITSVGAVVETHEDWVMLRQLGGKLAQGYYLAKPATAATFLEWAREHG